MDNFKLDAILTLPQKQLHQVMLLNDTALREALDIAVCNSMDKMREVVIEQATEATESSVKRAVEEYFKYGEGRKAIDTVVHNALSNLFKQEAQPQKEGE